MIGTVDSFLAAVAEAGHPPVRTQRTLATPTVLMVYWDSEHPAGGLPADVGNLARRLSALESAHPISFRTDGAGNITYWLTCWLWDNDKPPGGTTKEGTDDRHHS